jgi:hypothetical protein
MATDVHDAIVHTLHTRIAPSDSRLGRVEDAGKRLGLRLWIDLKRHPYVGIGAAAAAGIAIASVVGVGELAIGAALAYGVYNVVVVGMPPKQAATEIARELAAAKA